MTTQESVKNGNRYTALLSLDCNDCSDYLSDTNKPEYLSCEEKLDEIVHQIQKVGQECSDFSITLDQIIIQDSETVTSAIDSGSGANTIVNVASRFVSCESSENQKDQKIVFSSVDESEKLNRGSVEPSDPEIQLNLTQIRQNYTELVKNHRHLFTKQLMGQLWESWLSVSPELPGMYVSKLAQIRAFVMNPDQKELILHDRTSKHRYEYHQICGLLKLEHKSIVEDTDVSLNDITEEKWYVVGKHGKRHEARVSRDTEQYRHQHKTMNNEPGFEHFNKHFNREHEKKEVLKTLILTKPDNWSWEFTVVSDEQKKLDDLKLQERVQKHREWVKVMKTKRCSKCIISAVETELFSSKTLKGLYCEKCANQDEFMGHNFKYAYGRTF